ncbi:MAG: hypothetical protein AMJ53_00575 [Gammaproteobacteria bacterium SG8_11]|nr:MAG: hypothetical protein AMJ53_00575 [Gammaproteobacteria bacterium SG8_11]
MTESQPHCYSFRKLSPFQGFYHIIETHDAQAVTRDGLSWQINVKTTVPAQEWGSFGAKTQKQAILFGFWDKVQGMQQLPLNPIVSVDKIKRAVQPILENIASLSERLPFQPIDHYELWLLDKIQQQPLVLLASTSQPPLKYPKPLRWHASTTNDLGFIAPSLRAEIGDSQDKPHIYREAVERLIREETLPSVQWYERTTTAGGIAVDNRGIALDSSLSLEKAVFPPCLIRETWEDSRAANLIADYIRWQAPLLLQLTQLDSETRKTLEILARQEPEKVAQFHNLYPEIADQQQINAALVEAVMKRAQNS